MDGKNLTGYASIDKPWMQNYDNVVADESQVKMSIFQMLQKCTEDKLDLTAIYIPGKDNKGGLKIKYRTYLKECVQVAKSFNVLGTKKGEIIPLILPNIPESRFSIYGINYVGAIAYPLLPSLPVKVFEKILLENRVEKVVLFSGFYKKYKESLMKLGVKHVIITDGTAMIPSVIKFVSNLKAWTTGSEIPFESKKLKENSSILTWAEFKKIGKQSTTIQPFYEENTVAAIVGTSGTTGVPKGVQFTNESINYQAYQHLLAGVNYKTGDKILDILIQSISYGFSVMHYSGCFGLETVMIPNLVTDKIAETINELQPDHFTGGPVHFEYIYNSSLFKEGKLATMKNAISGGAKLPKEIEQTLNRNEVFVRQGYGTTECLGGATGPKGKYKLGSLGIPLPLTTIAIFEPGTDIEKKYNESGEICINGPAIMKGYLNKAEETEKALKKHSDGKIWLHTKDLGYCDEDGNIFFEDRLTDVFMRCGFNIHPSKIAEFLSSTQYVRECHVMGVEHHSEQMVPVAFIVLNPEYAGVENISEQLREECYQNLDEFAIPYGWIFVDHLPRNLGGKVDGKQLVSQARLDYSSIQFKESFSLTN